MRVDDFDFFLPEDRIALRPAVPRNSARMLQVDSNGELGDHIVGDLGKFLVPGDVLVLNNTKVFAAHLHGVRPARSVGGGGPAQVSINLHKCLDEQTWLAFARPAKRLRVDDELSFGGSLQARVVHKGMDGQVQLRFNASGAQLDKLFHQAGEVPLPPYIGSKRSVDARDLSDYQTVYADESGSVAAPTAGLHFTNAMLKDLESKGIEICYITLHVGAGTFLPVKVDDTDQHQMHAEWREIPPQSASTINQAREAGRRIIAVGTTSLRSLESAVSADGEVVAGQGDTDIFITPGHDFKVIDGLLTNFHLPKSTLFMLVSAFCGLGTMRKAYEHAINSGYRFYSYGDACLLWRSGCDKTGKSDLCL